MKKKVCESCGREFTEHEISVAYGALQWACPPLEGPQEPVERR